MKALTLHWNAVPMAIVPPHHILLWVSAAILAYEPVLWLFYTWFDPSYDSKGFIVFALFLTLLIWSITSPRITCCPNNKKVPFILLGISATIRLIGQIAAINIIGALTLVIDIYALARILGLPYRKRPLSPFWLATCFAFSLPLERLLQRSLGYLLQEISAESACHILGSLYDNVFCFGVRILINNKDVMVDLPCSGARSLLLLLLFYSISASIAHFSLKTSIIGAIIALLSALLANIIRICILAIGLAYPIHEINVMNGFYHDLIGLFTLSLGTYPIIIWAKYFYQSQKQEHTVLDRAKWIVPKSIKNDGWWLTKEKEKYSPIKKISVFLGTIFCLISAVTIVNLPRKALDVARPDLPLSLPYVLNNTIGIPIPLSEPEKQYFIQYGGSAKKAQYNEHTLMIIRTSAPLRHLHAPDECLRGLGMDVEYKGADFSSIPSAIYKAKDKQGNSYRIAVSFIPENQSHITNNVSEAVWRWIQNPKQSWTAMQRISHWDTETEKNHDFDQALIAALDIPTSNFQLAKSGENHEIF